MISFDEALQTILEAAHPLPPLERPLAECLGLGLGEPLRAQVDNPAFDNSAVDGYGVRNGAVGRLRLAGISAAGGCLAEAIKEGEAVRILTGAPVPLGVGAVVMQEYVTREDDFISIAEPASVGDHIRFRGEEYRAGDLLLEAGSPVTPATIALAAANGLGTLATSARPRVAVVVTGDELVSPGDDRAPNQIFESNGAGLSASVTSADCEVTYRAVVKDEPDLLAAAFQKGLDAADVLVVSGGMSVGDRDHARAVLKGLGFQEAFWRIKMRPGKPVLFGKVGEKLVFGLPGNPVSSLVTFHLLVRPALRRLMGILAPEPIWRARLATAITKAVDRTDFQRGLLASDANGMVVQAIDEQGSHMAGGLAVADCLLCLPAEQDRFEAGSYVRIFPLR